MTRMKARLVSREALNFLGEEIGVEHLLDAQTGKGLCTPHCAATPWKPWWSGLFGPGIQQNPTGRPEIAQAVRPRNPLQATVDFKSKLHEWGQKRKRKVQFKLCANSNVMEQQLYQMQVLVGGKVMGTSDGPLKSQRNRPRPARPVVISSATIKGSR